MLKYQLFSYLSVKNKLITINHKEIIKKRSTKIIIKKLKKIKCPKTSEKSWVLDGIKIQIWWINWNIQSSTLKEKWRDKDTGR